ncbi:MAG TPA: hypothetical protein ENH85_09780 [Candidatus Scalindua sp.]|nr:hypothetical protein [Candidatus Scalindua sp.]
MPIEGNTLKVKIDYQPLNKQAQFHDSVAKYRLYLGAWRAGKTFAGCQEAYKHSWLYKKNCGIVFRKDYADLRDTSMKTFFEVVPEEDIAGFNKEEHKVTLTNGSEIYFKYLKDGLKLGSLNLGWFFIDEAEQITEEIFTYLQGRLSLKNSARVGWLVSNPPNTDHWIYKMFEESSDSDFATFHASTYENEKHLPKDYIPSLLKLPISWQKKYLDGQYGFTPDGKPFYQGFIERIHKRQLSYNTEKVIYRSWDYGYRHPACSFHQIDAKGRWLILREVMGTDITIEKFGNYIKTMCKEWFSNVKFEDYGDPAGEQVSDKSEKTSVEILASLGIFVTSKPSTYRERKEIIERKLATLIEGIPALIVDEGCKVIVDGFLGGYHYQVRKPGQAFNPAIFEVPFKDGYYEHLENSVEYFAVNQFQGAETKKDLSRITHKVVGPFKDVQITVSNEEDNYGKYQRASAGVMIE